MDWIALVDRMMEADTARLKAIANREMEARVRDIRSLKCGNCDHWMKTTCYPEKQLNQFKSCASIACKDFTINEPMAEILEESIRGQYK